MLLSNVELQQVQVSSFLDVFIFNSQDSHKLLVLTNILNISASLPLQGI